MKKSGFIILVIIGIIALGIVLGLMGEPEDVKNNMQNKNTMTNTQNVDNGKNVQNNEVNAEAVNEENTQNTEEVKEEPKTEEEKVIELVKLDYGSADNVNIIVDEKVSEGVYRVSVRDKDTTKALAYYTVNVMDKTFSKREMN